MESGGYLIQTNDIGFRCNRLIHTKKPENKKRVFFFGDSFTAGDGVRNEVRYTDILEKLIPSIEVFNFGLPGSGVDQQYLIFKTFAGDLNPDVIIISVQVENIRRIVAQYRPYWNNNREVKFFAKPYYTLDPNGLVLHNQPVPRDPLNREDLPREERKYIDVGGKYHFFRKLAKRLGIKDLLLRLKKYQPLPEYVDPNNADWQLMKSILTKWIGECPCPVILIPLPLYHFIEGFSDPSDYQNRFREFSEEAGCTLHDPLPDLLKHSPRERREFRFPRDIHPTIKGHKALADSIRPSVQKVLNSKGL